MAKQAVQKITLQLLCKRPGLLLAPFLKSPPQHICFGTDAASKNEAKKKAAVIKKLHKENKKIFGELLEPKSDKVKRVKQQNKLTKKAKKNALISSAKYDASTSENLDPTQNEPIPDQLIDIGAIMKNNQPKDYSSIHAEINWNLKNFPDRSKVIGRKNPEVVIESFGPSNFTVVKKTYKNELAELSGKEMKQVPTLKQFLVSLELADMKPSFGKRIIPRRNVRQIGPNDDDVDEELPLAEAETEFNSQDYSAGAINVNSDNKDALLGSKVVPQEPIIIPRHNYTFYEAAEQPESTSSSSESVPSSCEDNVIAIPSMANVANSFDNQERTNNNFSASSSLIKTSPLDIISLPYEYKNYSKPNVPLPSVSKILQATMSPEQVQILEKWQQKMIEKLGEDGFKQYKAALFHNGKELHKNIQAVLSGTPREYVTIEDSVFGHWNSLQSILSEIQSVQVLESFVVHPSLNYCGIADCVASYRDKLVLIDWKTSEKRKSFISMTYDTPLQISAYIGALNHDPNYSFKVTEGLIVIAYQDGSPCQHFYLSANEIQKYWNQWIQRLKLFKEQEAGSVPSDAV